EEKGKKKEENEEEKKEVNIRIPLELDVNVKGDVADIKLVKERVDVKPKPDLPKPELPKPDCGGILDMVEAIVGGVGF
ncbi:hypothetical protein A2U01_0072628, partial [Trifolium medium]|nr:hypothetical protein [Trifolium medium]